MIGETLGHYRILRKLASGGMGDVYVAEDLKLGRRVALKVLPPELRSSPERRARFEHEARAVAALSHPNVLSIFEFGDDGNTLFAVTELLEGETLRERLEPGPLPPGQAMELARQMAAGLSAAHERGIVHRDLKPENVFLTREGQLKILDFGLVRWEEPESQPVEDRNESPTLGRFTEPGTVLGTVGYMSPEQVRGLPLDGRSDLFSFGAILYEMLSGQRAFSGATSADVMSAILRESPPALSIGAEESSRKLERIVGRCLEKSVDARFQSVRDLAFVLQSIATVPVATSRRPRPHLFSIAIVLALALGGLLLWMSRNPETPSDVPVSTPVVAVLLPENLTGDPENDFLSVGFADSLFTDLAGLPDVAVVPPSDIRAEVGPKGREHREIARTLGASFVVDSSIQRTGSQLRINVRLVASEGEVVWRSDFAGDMDGLFELQRRIAEGVADGLQIRLSPEASAHLGPRAGSDVDALAEYWRGRALLEHSDRMEDIEAAVSAFEAALAKDANLAEAQAGLGEAFWGLYSRTGEPSWVDRAIQASERALALAPSQQRVWLTLALVHNGTGRADLALEDLRRAILLQPNGDDAHRLMGGVLSELGRMEESLQAYDQAIERRPGYWKNHHRRGILLLRMGRHAEAKKAFETVTQLQPDSASGYQALGTLLQITGDLEGARQNYEKALQIAPNAGSYSNLGTIQYWEGRFEDAAEAYRRALELFPRSALYHRNLGDTYTRMGQMHSAKASYGTAVSLLEQDLEVNPKDVVALADLAVCMMKLGQLGRAEQHIHEALALAPDDGDVLYAQSVVAALAGRAEEALPLLRRAVDNGVSFYLVERDDDLASVRSLPGYDAWLRSFSSPDRQGQRR